MEQLMEPVSREILENELNSERFIRKTNNGNNRIFMVDYHNSPHVLAEIGRLRELTFREAGGGTGKSCDLDHFDTASVPYSQLIVWSPEDREIVGGYRFIKCQSVIDTDNHTAQLATSGLFRFSEKFIKDYLPYTIELGRSFVQPKYQPQNSRKGLFSMDNIWDGLGAIIVDNPDIKYFFGKVTMYPQYNRQARDLILYFFKKYFPDREGLMHAIQELPILTPFQEMEPLFKTNDLKEEFKVLNQAVRALGENIPPLVNIYMNLSATMKTFGTAMNNTFGAVEETGILITIADIYESKKERHINSYLIQKNQ